MSSLYVDIRQHPVGQGGFLTGAAGLAPDFLRERNKALFQWVYDCGSDSGSNSGSALCRELAILDGAKLDLLFISHIHRDHINGIKLLLQTCTVQQAVLPLLDDHARLLIAAHALAEGVSSEDLQDFLANPPKWLSERNVRRVTLVAPFNPDVDGPSPKLLEDMERYPEPPSSMKDELHGKATLAKDSSTEWLNAAGAPEVLDPNRGVWEVTGGATLKAMIGNSLPAYYFKPYVPEPDPKMLKAFRQEVAHAFGPNASATDIFQACKTPEGRARLRQCYRALDTGSIYETLNKFSMALWMGNRILRQNWLLTGDLPLKGAADLRKFSSSYDRLLNRIGNFVLPHHGSEASMDGALFDRLPPRLNALVSSRSGSSHHPGAVIRQIISRKPGIELIQVTEDPSTLFRRMQASPWVQTTPVR